MQRSWLVGGLVAGALVVACGGRTLPLEEEAPILPVTGGSGGVAGAGGVAGKGGTAGASGKGGAGGAIAGQAGANTAGVGPAGSGGQAGGVIVGGAGGQSAGFGGQTAGSGGAVFGGGAGVAGTPGGGFAGNISTEGGPGPGPGGPGPGPGGFGGSGQGGECGACVFELLGAPVCQQEQNECVQTNGCLPFAQCMQQAGCIGAPNPNQCAQQNGCQASPQARQAYRQGVRCLICEGGCADSGACDVQPGYCQGQGPGGPGGPGAGGSGSLEQQCEQCQEQNAPIVCQGTLDSCFSLPACSSIVQCMQNCPPDAQNCVDNCYQNGSPQGQQGYFDIVQCYYCQACNDSCGQLAPEICSAVGPF